jgi:RNA polymerase sigma-70 factor (ECF subfamily)
MDDTLTADLARDLDGSFERLVTGHQDRVYTIALRVVGNAHDAEEVAQDAFVRAYRALAAWEPARIRELQPRPWLAAIVVNVARNRLRRRPIRTIPLDAPVVPGKDPPPAVPELASGDPRDSPHERLLRRESADSWAVLLASLPEHYRVPVVLRHVDGLSYDEMSVALGRATGTLKAQVHRGLAQLRAAAEGSADLDREEMTA